MKKHYKTITALTAFFIMFSAFSAHCRAAGTDAPDAGLLAAYIEGSDADELYGMIAVGAVILNRIGSDGFTDSLSANASSLGIFPSPVPSDMAYYAARLAVSGVDPTCGAVHIIRKNDTDGTGAGYADITLVTCGLAFSR